MQKFGEALAESVKRYVANRISGKPLYVSLEVTERCNADCDFCRYRRSNNGDGRVTENLDSYLDTITTLNPIFLGLSGGETLLRKDLEQLVEEAKQRARVPYVTVTTNGSLLTKKRYLSLSEAGLDRLNISLDFASSRHDEMRDLPGTYQNILSVLEQVKNRRGATVGLNTIVMQDNLQEISEVVALAKRCSVQVVLNTYDPIKNAAHQHIVAGVDSNPGFFAELKREHPITIANPTIAIANIEEYLLNGRVGKCDAGRSFLWVLPNGRLRACIDRPESEGTTLQEVRAYRDLNNCNRCYTTCRSYAEMAANPLNAARIALEMMNKL